MATPTWSGCSRSTRLATTGVKAFAARPATTRFRAKMGPASSSTPSIAASSNTQVNTSTHSDYSSCVASHTTAKLAASLASVPPSREPRHPPPPPPPHQAQTNHKTGALSAPASKRVDPANSKRQILKRLLPAAGHILKNKIYLQGIKDRQLLQPAPR